MTPESGDDRADIEEDGSLPMIADPSTTALMGTVVLVALLMPPTVILVAVAMFLRWLDRNWRHDANQGKP